jgi:hypothetical protein
MYSGQLDKLAQAVADDDCHTNRPRRWLSLYNLPITASEVEAESMFRNKLTGY